MLIKGAILVVLIIAAFFFLGVKMSESITDPGIRGFFFALYFLTIFTVFNVILSFYFIIKLQGKRGPQGKKGLQGGNGDRGEPGTCDNTNCEKKSLELLIRNKVEDDFQQLIQGIDSDMFSTSSSPIGDKAFFSSLIGIGLPRS